MKTKNSIKKLVVAGMASAMIAAAVGSISGTVAWFQYNTRATAAYSGAAAHCSENLQIRLYDADLIGENKKYANSAAWNEAFPWGNELTTTMVSKYIKAKRGAWVTDAWVDKDDVNLYPVTSGELAINDVPGTMYNNPIAYYTAQTSWGTAGLADYVELPLQFRVADVDGNTANGEHVNYLAKKVYLSDLVIASKTVDDKEDISDAIRVAVDGGAGHKATFANADRSSGINTFGGLDLDPNRGDDGDPDFVYGHIDGGNFVVGPGGGMYQFEGEDQTSNLVYGTANSKARAYSNVAANDTENMKVVSITNPNSITGKEVLTTVAGKTTGTGAALTSDGAWGTPVKVRIYLEGWQQIDGSAIWNDVDFVGAAFNVGLTFTAEAHVAH